MADVTEAKQYLSFEEAYARMMSGDVVRPVSWRNPGLVGAYRLSIGMVARAFDGLSNGLMWDHTATFPPDVNLHWEVVKTKDEFAEWERLYQEAWAECHRMNEETRERRAAFLTSERRPWWKFWR